ADLDAPVPGHRVEVAGAADQRLVSQPADGEGDLPARRARGRGVVEPAIEFRAARVGQRVLPDAVVVRGGAQAVAVRLGQWFELHPAAGQDGNVHADRLAYLSLFRSRYSRSA